MSAADVKDGGPAFPSHGSMGEVVHEGMSLRDYFAAQAMQAYLITSNKDRGPMQLFAEVSYEMADAMIAAREVKP
jgi:hypothetical protein